MKPVVSLSGWARLLASVVGCGRQLEQGALRLRSGALTTVLKASSYPTAVDMMTDAPRSHTPDIELGTHLGSVILPSCYVN
jgi:hypothetical protein